APAEAPAEAPAAAPVDAAVSGDAVTPVRALAPADVAGVTSAGPAVTAGAATAAAVDDTSLLDAATDVVPDVVSDVVEDIDEAVGIRTAAGVGGLLAAGLIALVAVKRRRARKGRASGRTVVVPGPETPAGALERDLRT